MIDVNDFRNQAIQLAAHAPGEAVLVGLREITEGDPRYRIHHHKGDDGHICITVTFDEFRNFWGYSQIFEYTNKGKRGIGAANMTMRETFSKIYISNLN